MQKYFLEYWMAVLKQKFPVCVGKESFSIKTTEKSCKITENEAV